MREALLEGHELALGGPVVALGEQRHRAADLERAIHVVKEGAVAVAIAIDRDEAAGVANDEPLDFARDQDRRVSEEVDAGLEREEQEQRELVEPVEVVGDEHVVARTRDVLLAPDVESEHQAEERDAEQPDQSIRNGRLAADGKEIGGWERGPGHGPESRGR